MIARIILLLILLPVAGLANPTVIDLGSMSQTSASAYGNYRYDAGFSNLNGVELQGQSMPLRLLFVPFAAHAPFEYYYASLWLYTDGNSYPGVIQGTGRLIDASADMNLVSNSSTSILAAMIAADYIGSDPVGAEFDMTLPSFAGTHITNATLTIRTKTAVAEPSSGALFAAALLLLIAFRRIR